jgi:hypothetical protein
MIIHDSIARLYVFSLGIKERKRDEYLKFYFFNIGNNNYNFYMDFLEVLTIASILFPCPK